MAPAEDVGVVADFLQVLPPFQLTAELPKMIAVASQENKLVVAPAETEVEAIAFLSAAPQMYLWVVRLP